MRTLVTTLFLVSVCLANAQAQAPLGKWEWASSCVGPNGAPAPAPPFQILIAKDGDALKGIFASTAQGFVSELKAVVRTGPNLHLEVDVPNNTPVTLDGTFTDSTWNAQLRQGPFMCQVVLRLDSQIELTSLKIPPSYQSQQMWCWITVGEMIFRHVGVLNDSDPPGHTSQCGIVRTIFKGSDKAVCTLNCDQCALLGGGSAREIAGMLTDFPRRMLAEGRRVPRVFSSVAPPLSFTEINNELARGYPVLAGISPGQQYSITRQMDPFLPPMHAVLIVGTLKTNKGTWYLVNDPYPFPPGAQNPYLMNGALPLISSIAGAPKSSAYFISEDKFKNAMVWSESILIRVEK